MGLLQGRGLLLRYLAEPRGKVSGGAERTPPRRDGGVDGFALPPSLALTSPLPTIRSAPSAALSAPAPPAPPPPPRATRSRRRPRRGGSARRPWSGRQHKTKAQPAIGMQSFGHDYGGLDGASAPGQSDRRSRNLNFSKWSRNVNCHEIRCHRDSGWYQVAAVILRADFSK